MCIITLDTLCYPEKNPCSLLLHVPVVTCSTVLIYMYLSLEDIWSINLCIFLYRLSFLSRKLYFLRDGTTPSTSGPCIFTAVGYGQSSSTKCACRLTHLTSSASCLFCLFLGQQCMDSDFIVFIAGPVYFQIYDCYRIDGLKSALHFFAEMKVNSNYLTAVFPVTFTMLGISQDESHVHYIHVYVLALVPAILYLNCA